MILRSQRPILVRYYSKKGFIEKAFTERLNQLESEHISKNDKLLGEDFKSLIDEDEKLLKLAHDLDQKKYEYENQKSIQTSRIPSYATKQTRELANASPWTGSETQQDTSLRMIVDKYKPLKIKSDVRKLASAKEAVLDFKINSNKISEEDQFRNIYKEKFTPIGSFDKIKTIADARIEEAMRSGAFNNIPRGKGLDTEVKPYVDRTEHHLNNILIKQNIVPPWIEKQSGVNLEIYNLRNELQMKWINHVKNFYHNDCNTMKEDFNSRWKKYYENKIALTNNNIRTYNLQAPLSTQKFYLIYDKEFEKSSQSVNIEDIRKLYMEEKSKSENASNLQKKSNKFSFSKLWKW
ncbi:hypothetical protein WICMUC_005905 [Wickerhamomyces mucosus]|uniref:DnaJ homologue subfamily C member 28 conserved domain-containing protein n=1 Tax=Wickerhamomyces mucosus TaxID=1378264 RepID=A0A9P8T2B2_9ASCO|nr:hypothetical protein WICMUC_005905 [Wickerhamomyces mucosus]